MSTGNLPSPEAAGPTPGSPGHFDHHDWLTGSVKALDERLIKAWSAQSVTVTMPSGSYVACKYDTVIRDQGGLDADLVSSGGVLMGPAAPSGLYRIDAGVSIEGNTTGSRRAKVAVNQVDDLSFYLTGAALPTGAWAWAQSMSGVLVLAPGDLLEVDASHNAGSNLLTNASGQTRLFLEYLGAVTS